MKYTVFNFWLVFETINSILRTSISAAFALILRQTLSDFHTDMPKKGTPTVFIHQVSGSDTGRNTEYLERYLYSCSLTPGENKLKRVTIASFKIL